MKQTTLIIGAAQSASVPGNVSLNLARHLQFSAIAAERGVQLLASVVKSMESHPARAGPLESLVLDCALTVSNIGPPYLETHGPPGQWNPGGLGEFAGQAGNSKQKGSHRATFSTLHEIPGLQPTKLKNRGFAPRFS